MIKAKFPAFIRNGKLAFKDQMAFVTHVAAHKEGTEVWVTVGKKQRDRTLSQNAWYWAAILPIISDWSGHDVDDLHEIFKKKFLPPKFVDWNGTDVEIPSSSAKLSTKEFTDYIERIRAEVAESGVIIPDPNSIDYDWIDR